MNIHKNARTTPISRGVMDLKGNLLFTLGERHELQPFNHPTDIAVAPDGDIDVCDGYAGSRVHWFSKDGRLKKSWGEPGEGPAEFSLPHGIWVLRDGRVLVADLENCRVQVFTRDGAYLTEWHDFDRPTDIYVDKDDVVYVADEGSRLTALTPEGKMLGRCRATVSQPHGIYGDSKGNIYVSESTARPARICKLTLVTS